MPHQRERNAVPSSTALRTARSDTYRLAIKFAYDGTDFHGFQSQPHGNTIQDQLESKLKMILQRKKSSLRIFAWGRTDRGVHAKNAVCTVDLTHDEVQRLAQRRGGGEGVRGKRSTNKEKKSKNKAQLHSHYPDDGDDDDDESMTVPTNSPATASSTNDVHEDVITNTTNNNNNKDDNSNSNSNTNDDDDNTTTQQQNTILLKAAAQTLCRALSEFTCPPGQVGSITARTCLPVPNDFDARFSSCWKRYIYYIVCSTRHRSPLLSRYAWQMSTILNVTAMKQAVHLLNGRHAFHWLSVRQRGDQLHPMRDLQLTMLCKEEEQEQQQQQPFVASRQRTTMGGGGGGPCSFFPCEDEDTGMSITISATSDFFLYRMVRRIVGVVVAIGKGQVSIQQLESCLQAHDTEQEQASDTLAAAAAAAAAAADTEAEGGSSSVVVAAGTKTKIPIPDGLLQTAPPNGLFLDHIEYNIPI
jgi:tRNA U38,U39,U40 pseudouridine synthase TruA